MVVVVVVVVVVVLLLLVLLLVTPSFLAALSADVRGHDTDPTCQHSADAGRAAARAARVLALITRGRGKHAPRSRTTASWSCCPHDVTAALIAATPGVKRHRQGGVDHP